MSERRRDIPSWMLQPLLTEEAVIAMRQAHKQGWPMGDLAKAHGVNYGCVESCIYRRSYRWVASP